MAPVLSRSLVSSASFISLSSSIRHPNNKVFNLRSVFLPQNNGLRKGFSCSGLKWKPEKRIDKISVRCEAAVAEQEAADTSGEKFEYQAEVSRLLDLIVHSLYSHKEVFLRELVSNASDALDKLRFLSVTEPSLLGDAGDLEIRIRSDLDNGTITVTDTGIGMTKEELVDCLGTIAQSGTSKFLKALKENKDVGADNGLIGQFGVGFYSAFLVAEKVVVSTKSPKSDKQYVWESEAESSSYVIKEVTDPEKILRRGTEITLYLKAKINKFLEKTKKRKNLTNKISEGESGAAVYEGEKLTKEQEKLRKKVTTLMKKQKVQQLRRIVKGHDDSMPWGQEAHLKVGSRLIQLMIESAYIQPPTDQIGDGPPDIRPAFVHTLKTMTKDTQKSSRRYGVIECDPLVRKGLEKSARHMVIPYLPMLVPPLNWTGFDQGAYFFLPSYVMRIHGAKQQRVAIKRASRNQLEPVFKALDTLGNTKWRVNKRILAVIDRIWASGGHLAGLVDREDVHLPEEPQTEDEAEIQKWRWKVKSVKKENSERHSQRCDVELKLAVARKMKDEEGFYYPHNLDFRGRAYPMHPYLNHLGSDVCRGILEFAEGRPLGKSGLRWLKIHLANLYAGGVDKLSYDGRISFTENHLDDIFDSADRPLEGQRWWLGAEDPFQCLAVCINLSEALRSPSPETAISHTPVHQDGLCNGLQHYAALGRDKLGAAAVNLVGGGKPADVYSGIAARVLDIMRRDAEIDPAINPNSMHAKLLVDQVDRKLVKQTVMTSVYGVTYIGARDQIKRRLKERCIIADVPQLYSAACYAAKTTLTALEEMFEGARGIMAWLGECAKVIASENQPVQWTTPFGLPVVQPYRQLGRQLIKTSLQVLSLQRETDKVMVRRQRTAFPPNFVHSLDGSHMMMTAVACKEAGLNFAGVHDSYWTHACDVDEMNRILREKFVELYETPILENLLESFQSSFPDLKFPPLPERGDFDLRDVLQSTYFFN